MGSGKTINLDDPEFLQKEIDKVLDSVADDESLFCLYLGEPNCRIKLSNHWTPHWDELHHGKSIDSTPDIEYLKNSIDNYKRIDTKRIDYIITPTCAYDPVIPSLKIFNQMLKDAYGNKLIDIFKYSIGKNDKVLNKFKAKDWKKDPIHLNSRICDHLVDELYQIGAINNKLEYNSNIDGYFGTHLLRCADKTKFGSFIIRK